MAKKIEDAQDHRTLMKIKEFVSQYEDGLITSKEAIFKILGTEAIEAALKA